MDEGFRLGPWVVRPNLNSISRDGRTTRLEPKMMEVLTYLSQQSGSVVSKEQLINAVWRDTFVTDDVLIRCISELRRAVNDDPKEPQFIETVPKRGYRLLQVVELLPAVEPARPQPEDKLARRWKLAIAVVLFAAAIAATFYARKPRRLTELDTVVLADFDNRTSDPVFDDTLKQALATELQQSPVWNIVSDQKIRDTLGLMGRSPRERLNEDTARDLCQRVAGKAVLSGSIASFGNQYVIGVKAVECNSGKVLSQQQVQAATKEEVLKALGQQTTKLRQNLGESLTSIRQFDRPLEQFTTPSLDALKAFAEANIARVDKGDRAAIPFLRRAIELDPNFAMAHAYLGAC